MTKAFIHMLTSTHSEMLNMNSTFTMLIAWKDFPVGTWRVHNNDMKRENQLDATQWFIELMIRPTCFGQYYAHHEELETIEMITACGT
jgi:hypothetical protein